MLFYYLIILANAEFKNLIYGDLLSPLELVWPNSWVPRRLFMNSNSQSSASEISIYFSVDSYSKDLSNYYAAIKLPNDLSYTSCKILPYNLLTNDWLATCQYSFDNYSNSIIGPISFYIAVSPKGQVISRDYSVGYLAFSPPEGEPENLKVSYSQNSSHIVQASESLDFSFTLQGSKNFYPGDYFLLKIDSKFRLNSTGLSFNSSLDLLKGAKTVLYSYNQETWIYITGILNEIPAGSPVGFTIDGWINPDTSTLGANYNWVLTACRFGTQTVIKRFTGKGPLDDVKTGSVQVLSWGPYSSAAFGNPPVINTGLTCFWTVSFVTQHDVPAFGSILVSYSGLNVSSDGTSNLGVNAVSSTANDLYISFSSQYIATSLSYGSSSSILIQLSTDSLAAGNVITLSHLGTVGPTNPGILINTQSSVGVSIDSLQGVNTILRSPHVYSSSAANDNYSSGFLARSSSDPTKVVTVNQKGNFGLSVNLNLTTPLSQKTKILIYLPLSIGSTYSFDTIVFPNNCYGYQNNDANTQGFTSTTFGSNPSLLSSVMVSTGLLTVNLAASTSSFLNLFIAAGTVSSPLPIYTPLIPTRGPSEILIKIQQDSAVSYFFSALKFIPNPVTVDSKLLCPSVFITGTPLRLSYSSLNWNLPGYLFSVFFSFRRSYEKVAFPIFLPSNLNDGDLYPCSDKSLGLRISKNDQLFYKSANSYLFSSVDIPLPALSKSGSYTVDLKVYLINSTQNFLISTGSSLFSSSADLDLKTGSPSGISPIYTTSVSTNLNIEIPVIGNFTDINGDSFYSISNAPVSYLLVLPIGWTSDDQLIGGVSLTAKNFPSRTYYKEQADTVDETSQFKSITLSVKSDWFVTAASQFVFAVSYGMTFPGLKCVTLSFSGSSLSQLVATANKIQISDYKPTSVSSYCYNSRIAPPVSVNFQSNNFIGKGSVISITLDGWLASQSNWKVSAGEKSFQGSLAGQVWTSEPVLEDMQSPVYFSVAVIGAALPSSAITGFSSIIVLYKSSPYLTWTDTNKATSTLITPTPVLTQKVSNSSIWVHPNIIGSKSVYFGLSFYSKYLIPAGATFSLSGPFKAHPNIENDFFSSHFFSSVDLNNGKLSFVAREDVKENDLFSVVLDSAFDLTQPQAKVYLTVTCDDFNKTVVIQDSENNAATYQPISEPSLSVLSFKYTSQILEAGYDSFYNFSVSVNSFIKQPFWLEIDANGDFSAVPGPSFTRPMYGSGFKFLSAFDWVGNEVLCYATHWVISCYMDDDFNENQVYTFKVLLKNGQSSGYFNLYILDVNETVIAKPFYSSQIVKFNPALSGIIDPRNVVLDYSKYEIPVFQDLSVKSFVDLSAVAKGVFYLKFPPPYDLSLLSSITCSLTYYNTSSALAENIIDKSSCQVSDNKVLFALPYDRNFKSSNWTVFSVFGLDVPDSGYNRSSFIYELSAPFDYYSLLFDVNYFDSSSIPIAASFKNLHFAYSGFFTVQNFTRLIVNDAKPIFLTPGTVNGPFTVKSKDGNINSLVISISATGNLYLSDNGKYSLSYSTTSTSFFVGTSSQTHPGAYLIHWEIKETPIPGQSKKYIKPKTTVVYVSYDSTYQVKIEDENIVVPLGSSGFPVKFLTDIVTPFDNIIINFQPRNASLGISFSPSSLILDQSHKENYVFIMCKYCIPLSVNLVDLSLSGSDTSSFFIKSSFNFTSNTPYQTKAKAKFSFFSVTSNGFIFNLVSDSNAVVTWCLISSELSSVTNISYPSLLNISRTIDKYNSSLPSTSEQISKWSSNISSVIDSYSDYNSITKYIKYFGKNLFFTGQSIIYPGQNTIYLFSNLVPKSTYWLAVYVDNFSGELASDIKEITLGSLPNHALLSISLNYQIDVQNLTYSLGIILQWNVKYINIPLKNNSKLSNLTAYIYADPTISYSPYSKVTLKLGDLKSALSANISVRGLSFSNFTQGKFLSFNWNISDRILILNFSAQADGTLFCTVGPGKDLALSTFDVYVGMYNDQKINQYNLSISASEIYNFSIDFVKNNYSADYYSVSCIVCNSFPGQPSCSDVSYISLKYESDLTSSGISGSMSMIFYMGFFLLS